MQRLIEALPDSVDDWDNAKKTALDSLRDGRKHPIELEERQRARHSGNGANDAHTVPPPAAAPDDPEPSPALEPEPAAKKEPPKRKKRSLNVTVLVNFLVAQPEWRGPLRVNLFTEALQVTEQFPPAGERSTSHRPFREPVDLLEAMVWLQGAAFARAGTNGTLSP